MHPGGVGEHTVGVEHDRLEAVQGEDGPAGVGHAGDPIAWPPFQDPHSPSGPVPGVRLRPWESTEYGPQERTLGRRPGHQLHSAFDEGARRAAEALQGHHRLPKVQVIGKKLHGGRAPQHGVAGQPEVVNDHLGTNGQRA